MPDSTFLTRVIINNYKSIQHCDVKLGPLTFLVGRNGSGKSNFLDALQFVSDALNNTLEQAVKKRGGINEIILRSRLPCAHFVISLTFRLSEGMECDYEIRLGSLPKRGFEVLEELCRIRFGIEVESFFQVQNGKMDSNPKLQAAHLNDRLYLVAASGNPVFRPAYDALRNMQFYDLNPDILREARQPDAGEKLWRDGDNIASVISKMKVNSPEKLRRVEQYLEAIVPGLKGVGVVEYGSREELEFFQEVVGFPEPQTFSSLSMSDGTLRALGVLVALFQTGDSTGVKIPLVEIEEPETGLHPSAIGVLYDALTDASETRQVIVTTHGSDLLDRDDIDPDSILAVSSEGGITRIAPIDDASRTIVSDEIYTLGEMLRMNQILPRFKIDSAHKPASANELVAIGGDI